MGKAEKKASKKNKDQSKEVKINGFIYYLWMTRFLYRLLFYDT